MGILLKMELNKEPSLGFLAYVWLLTFWESEFKMM